MATIIERLTTGKPGDDRARIKAALEAICTYAHVTDQSAYFRAVVSLDNRNARHELLERPKPVLKNPGNIIHAVLHALDGMKAGFEQGLKNGREG